MKKKIKECREDNGGMRKMEKEFDGLDNRQSQKYCPHCGGKMYKGMRCPNCHAAS